MWTVLLMSDIQWISGWPSLVRAVSCGYMRALSYEHGILWLQGQSSLKRTAAHGCNRGSLLREQRPMAARAILSHENSGLWLQGRSSLKRTAAHGCKGDPLLREQGPMAARAILS
jgi:hypothetical protein